MAIPIMFPREADEGLWGGEGFIKGFFKKKDNPLKNRYASNSLIMNLNEVNLLYICI